MEVISGLFTRRVCAARTPPSAIFSSFPQFTPREAAAEGGRTTQTFTSTESSV
jgi:hypothetical protein